MRAVALSAQDALPQNTGKHVSAAQLVSHSAAKMSPFAFSTPSQNLRAVT